MKKSTTVRKALWLSLCMVFTYYIFYGMPRVASNVRETSGQCGPPAQKQGADIALGPEDVWDEIVPGTVNNLSWTPCFYHGSPSQLCAKLMVPLDYAHPEGDVVTMAIIKIPAAIPPTDARYKGPILFNPGGPGGSGVSFMGDLGGRYQDFIGDDFDIVSFDPRGVARTQPQVLAFPDEAEGASWYLKTANSPPWNTTPDALPRMYAASKVLNAVVDVRVGNAAAHVGATLVSRDMLSILQALGRERLQFWGISYGTILGTTFAAMFPDKVERMVLDGVLDADDYYSSTWKKSFTDTDEALHKFFQACVSAGPEKCAIHEPTPEDVHARLTRILENLKRSPVAVLGSRGGVFRNYGIIDYRSVRTLLFMFLSYPYTSNIASRLASALRALEDGNGGPLWNLISGIQAQFGCNCSPEGPNINTREAPLAIVCTDSAQMNDTVEDLDKFFHELSGQSEFADAMLTRVSCVGWKSRPAERFTGPFVGNTSYPILFIGNTLDPITPLANAHTMSRGFDGSVVLTQESGGHTSLAAPTPCTFQIVKDYFRDGVLPAKGTVCNFKHRMFDDVGNQIDKESVDLDHMGIDAWSASGSTFLTAWKGILF